MTLKSFFYSTPYLMLLSVYTIIVWSLKIESIGLPILLVVLFLQFLFLEDTIPTIAILFNALFIIGDGYNNWTMETIPLYIYLAPIAIFVGMIGHLIKFKQKLFQGKLLVGIAIMFFAVIGSTFNAAFLNLNYFFYLLVGTLYGFVYFVYVGSIKSDHVKYLMTLFLLTGIVISLEILIYYIRVEDMALVIEHKLIHLGWGVSNYVATYLIMFIPATIYFAKKSKHTILWLVLFVGQGVSLFFTVSRAGVLAFLFILPFLLLYLIKNNSIKKTLIYISISISFFLIVFLIIRPYLSMLYQRIMERIFDDNGRIQAWTEALTMFRQHPLFGGGIFAKYDTMYRMYHNTIFHVMATMGIVGLIGLIHQIYYQFALVLKKFTPEGIIFAIGMLGAHAHGMVDNIYLMPQFMIIIMVIVATFEVKDRLLLPPNTLNN